MNQNDLRLLNLKIALGNLSTDSFNLFYAVGSALKHCSLLFEKS